jgi:hypothetical protein
MQKNHYAGVFFARTLGAGGVSDGRQRTGSLFRVRFMLGTSVMTYPNSGGDSMNRELALKIVLVLVGVLFLALAYPMVVFVRQDPALSMMLSLYVTLGVFLLLAIQNPTRNRSLIAFTAWSSLVHGALMGFQAMRGMVQRGEMIGVAVLIVIGVALIGLAPRIAGVSVAHG